MLGQSTRQMRAFACAGLTAALGMALAAPVAHAGALPERPNVAFLLSLTRLRAPTLQLSTEISGLFHPKLAFGGGGFWGDSSADDGGFVSSVQGGRQVPGTTRHLAGGHVSGQWTLVGTPQSGLRAGLWLGYAQTQTDPHPLYVTEDASVWYATPTLGGRWTTGPMVVAAHVGYGPGWQARTVRCCGAPSRETSDWGGVWSGSLDLGVAF